MDWARRRLGVLAAHLVPSADAPDARGASPSCSHHHQDHQQQYCARASGPDASASPAGLSRCPTSGCERCNSGSNAAAPYATADPSGAPNAYARVHGAVSRDPPRWRRIASVARERLEDVIYEKAEGEGIAKVRGMGRGVGSSGFDGVSRSPRGSHR